MTTRELFDRINTWISMYPQISLPPRPDPALESIRRAVESDTINGQLQNVSQLQVTQELAGSPVEADLRKAIDYAKAADSAKLDEVYRLLVKVHKYMSENGLR